MAGRCASAAKDLVQPDVFTVRIRLTLGLFLVVEGPRGRQIWNEGELKRPSFDSVCARRASIRRIGWNGEGQPVDRYSTARIKTLWAVWLHQASVRSHEAGNWENPHKKPAHSWGKKWDRHEALGYGRQMRWDVCEWMPDVWIHVQISSLGIAVPKRIAPCHTTSTAPSRPVTCHNDGQHM